MGPNKTDMLERSVTLTHALLALPENVQILRIDVDNTRGTTIQIYGHDGHVPEEEDDRDYDTKNGVIRHFRDMGNGITLLWLTDLVTGDCSTCGKDCLYCDDECRRDVE